MAAPGELIRGNQFAVGNEGGRPAKYETPEALFAAGMSYFEYIKGETIEKIIETEDPKTGIITKTPFKETVRHAEPATVTGLVLHLGFASRQSLDDYGNKNEFSDIIKRFRLMVENQYEARLHGDKNVGAIFALKNMGWKDKVENGFTDEDGRWKPSGNQAMMIIVQPGETHGLSIKEIE